MRPLKACSRQNIQHHLVPHSVSRLAQKSVISERSVTTFLKSRTSCNRLLQHDYGAENEENLSATAERVPETSEGIESALVSVTNLEEMSEVLVDMVISEFGSSYIVNLLSRRNGRLRRCLYECIFSPRIFNTVSNDCYGHRTVEVLVASASAPEQQLIASTLRGHMVEFASARFISRIVQCALQKLDIPTGSTLLTELRGMGRYLVTHSFASHVVEVIFSRMRPLHYGFIIDELICSPEMIVDVACDKYGCRVLEFAIQVLFASARGSHSSVADEFLHKLLKAIVDACSLEFVADEYGNFVVQKIIAYEQLDQYADAIITNIISRNVLLLSQTKHGSHVVQAVLRSASPKSLRLIMREIFDGYDFDTFGKDALDVLMIDGYGNYVVQTMLDVSIAVTQKKRNGSLEWFERLAGRIIRAKDSIVRFSSGKKLIGTLNEVLGTLCESTMFDDASGGKDRTNEMRPPA